MGCTTFNGTDLFTLPGLLGAEFCPGCLLTRNSFFFSSGDSIDLRSALALCRLASRPVSVASAVLDDVLLESLLLGVPGTLLLVLGELEASLLLLLPNEPLLFDPTLLTLPTRGELFLGDDGALPDDDDDDTLVRLLLVVFLSPRNVLNVDGVRSTFSLSVKELCLCRPGEFLGDPYGRGIVEVAVLNVFERPTFLLSVDGLELR